MYLSLAPERMLKVASFTRAGLGTLPLLTLLLSGGRGAYAAEPRIRGRLLEACSCIVPCPCNFGRGSTPHDFCESLAFFEVQSGEMDRVPLDGSRFAVAARDGSRATLFLDPRLPAPQRNAIKKIATWILSLEGTHVTDIITAPVIVEFGSGRLSGSIEGADINLVAFPLRGNDGESSITVSRPWIFGAFPVTSSRKLHAEKLRVRAPGLSFDYTETNANDAIFDFLPSQVR